ncbi:MULTISPECIES: hypothetical protein [Pelosinus]|uniref:Lipoprotein n=1 Tax=Pelosinus fermentans B4 TaxID=1149862 RepID=I9B448_9FIRM|nr:MULTISPECIES: hypothetical protein [Pelosinus]EIW19892.1 hypothetical protein FB4_0143 [Pelosinus fermentans B4]EIW21251.1 hypothetical protein FA11_0978 [Pelosinus fermentans A11]
MGKIKILSLIILVALAIGGCSSSPKAEPAKPVVQEVQKPSKPKIPGVTAADVKINLEKTWKLKFSSPESMQEGGIWYSGEIVDRDTGARLKSSIYGESPMSINRITYTVEPGPAAAATTGSVIAGYLGYCSTLPYEGGDPAKAKAWVNDTLPKVKAGASQQITIGTVEYELVAVGSVRTLKIRVVE